ncbi:uncharacterized protein LOC108912554 isoform X2 [Anoplophora glabripennis]|uniref:uncharacterized protein LOC108912554 isoform X2 n=1 Tax=Anoplophora glabripennis TaxID=217634 RepID=UPI0008743A9A|nr:uncharacterized protein LOC108912554 isoform X2 [Anoplophora glabripennis]
MLHTKLCNSPEFSRRFGLYYPCIQELRKDLDGCDGSADWYQDKDETEVCKNYKHIIDCYYIKIAKVCGIDAAKTLKELAVDVMDSIVDVKCSNVCEDPDVKDPMPAKYINGKAEIVQSSMETITFFTFLRLYLI